MVLISTSLFASVMLSDRSMVASTSALTVALSAVASGRAPSTVTETIAKGDSFPSSSSTV